MRYHQIKSRPAMSNSHPFVTDIVISPSAFGNFERAMEGREEVRLLARVDGPNSWLVHLGCSSAMVRRVVQAGWKCEKFGE